MPTINRYTQLSNAQFDPLSLQEISLVPTQLRKQQDELENQASELGIIKSNRLSPDEAAVSGAISEYEQKVADYTDRLDSEGYNKMNASALKDLAREKRDLVSPTGLIGRKQAAYNAYGDNMIQLDKSFAKGTINADKYGALKNQAITNYKNDITLDDNAIYNPVIGVKDYDIQKNSRQIALDIQNNPKILEKFGMIHDPKTGRYYDTKNKLEYTPEKAISVGIRAILGQNPDVQSDLQQRSELGLLGELDPAGYLKNIGDTYESLYSKNNKTETRNGYFNPVEVAAKKKALEANLDNKSIDFEKYNYENIELHSKSDIGLLSDIVNGKQTVDVAEYTKYGTPGLLTSLYDAVTNNVPLTPTKFESIEGPLKDRAVEVFESLKVLGDVSNDSVITDPGELVKVVKYMQDHQAVTSQPKIKKLSIKDGVNKSKDIINQARSRVFYDSENNETYSYDDMVDKGYLTDDRNENYKNIVYRGQMSADNVYSSTINSEYRGGFVTPDVIELKGKQFIIPNSEGELQSEDGINNAKFNKNYNKLYRSADLPLSFQWNNDGVGQNAEITHLSKGSKYYKGPDKPYLISTVINGKPGLAYLSTEEFKNMQEDLN
jgi:hypothetical protein